MRKSIISLCLTATMTFGVTAQGWVDVTPTVPGPGTQVGTAAMCFDPVRQLTWLFQGTNQVFSWDGLAWTNVAAPPAPSSGSGGGPWQAVWDESSQSVVVARAAGSAFEFTTWDGTSWSLLPLPTLYGSAPAIERSQLVADPLTGQLTLIYSSASGAGLNKTVFDGVSWQPLGSAGPAGGNVSAGSSISSVNPSPSFFFDSTIGRSVLVNSPYLGSYPSGAVAPEYWEWDGATWVQAYPATLVDDLGPVVQAPNRGICAAIKWDPALGPPRMFTIADREFEQLYLTNWPSMRRDSLLAYDSVRDRFIIHGGNSVYASGTYFHDTWELELGPEAAYSTFGAGCMGSGGIPAIAPQANSMPVVNSQFTVQVSNLPWTGPTFMWTGFSNQAYGSLALPVNLAGLGAPQCNVLISPDLLYSIPNVLGTSIWTLSIPNMPGFTFYNQAIAFDAQANSLGLVFSNAGEAVVGQ